jgi:hypothetical protein
MAPPTIAVDNSPEARVVNLPNPLTEREKIMANITELKNPTKIRVHTAIFPVEFADTAISKMAIRAQVASIADGLINFKISAPNKNLPTSMLPQ